MELATLLSVRDCRVWGELLSLRGCCHQLPQVRQLGTTRILPFTIWRLEVQDQGVTGLCSLWMPQQRVLPPSSSFWESQASLGLWPPPSDLCHCLHMGIFSFCASSRCLVIGFRLHPGTPLRPSITLQRPFPQRSCSQMLEGRTRT